MLRLARHYRGFHQKELAERVGVDAAYLSRAENGTVTPSPPVVERCATALNVRAEFFFRPFNVSGLPLSYHPMFRKRQSVAQRDTDRVLADANIRAMHLRTLMPSVEFKPELSLPRYDPDEYKGDYREIARLVRRAWAIPSGPLLNLTSYVERAGIFVFHADLEKIDVDGLTLRLAGLPPVIVLNKHMPGDRLRFTLAHELAHLVMHDVPSREMEKEANAFASALLLPIEDLRSHLRSRPIDLRLIARLKPEWRVSMAALIYAAHANKLISDDEALRLRKRMSAMGFNKSEPPELNVSVEQTTLDKALFNAHLNGLGYTLNDLTAILFFPPDDLAAMYGLPQPRRVLHIVR